MAADTELMSLRAEEAEITARMGTTSLDEAQPSDRDASNGNAPENGHHAASNGNGAASNGAGTENGHEDGDDADADRLTAIYDRLQVRACLR